MKFYLLLELKRVSRKIRELGFNPIVVLLFLSVALPLAGYTLISSLTVGSYLFSAVGVSMVLSFQTRKKRRFYSQIMPLKDVMFYSLIEALLVVSPFVLILSVCGKWTESVVITSLVVLNVLAHERDAFSIKSRVLIMPTPFKNHPFEMIIGFRKVWMVYLILLLITTQAIEVDNYNLGLAVLIISAVVTLFFYSKPEPDYYVWIHRHKSHEFLILKLKQSVIGVTVLLVPQMMLLFLFFPDKIHLTCFGWFVGVLYMALGVFSKYAYYPNEMNVIQSISVALSILMPPLLLLAIPVFWTKANNRLKNTLS